MPASRKSSKRKSPVEALRAADPVLRALIDSIGVDGIGDYRGALELRPAGAAVAVVNDVGLDDYLRGISEMPSNWPAAHCVNWPLLLVGSRAKLLSAIGTVLS